MDDPQYSFLDQVLHGGPLVIFGYVWGLSMLGLGLWRFGRALLTGAAVEGVTKTFAWIPLAIGAALTALPICTSFPSIPKTSGLVDYPPIEVMLGEAFAPLFHGAVASLSVFVLSCIAFATKKKVEQAASENRSERHS